MFIKKLKQNELYKTSLKNHSPYPKQRVGTKEIEFFLAKTQLKNLDQ